MAGVAGSGARQGGSEAEGECAHSWRLFEKSGTPATPEVPLPRRSNYGSVRSGNYFRYRNEKVEKDK